MPNTIIISDLDGTLLDAATYSFDAALPALNLLRARDIPLILCSSKTRAEMEAIRQQLRNDHPFVAENGGGIFIPKEYFPFPVEAAESGSYRLIALGTPYAEIRRHFVRLRDELGIRVRGFADMTVDEVAELTGLSRDAALLARQRDFDEPFVFDGAPDERFLRAIEASGLSWTEGRIFHIMGRHDKGRAVNLLKSLYAKKLGKIESIGLGDSLNDREKPEVSGTARKIAETLEVGGERITSLRLGGIVGHHEVIFGFPHQTVRLTHESIRREAFGTGAAFALNQLVNCAKGFYTFDDLLLQLMRAELINEH